MQAASLEQITDYAQVRFDFLTDRKTTTLNQCLSLTAIKDDGTRPRTSLLEIKPTSVSKNNRKRARLSPRNLVSEKHQTVTISFSPFILSQVSTPLKKRRPNSGSTYRILIGSLLCSVLCCARFWVLPCQYLIFDSPAARYTRPVESCAQKYKTNKKQIK